MATSPLLPQPGAQAGTIPGGGGSQNLTPLQSGTLSLLNKGNPVTATVPGGTASSFGTGGNLQIAPPPSTGAPFNTADTSYSVTGDFKDTYGAGTGTALAGILAGLGTNTSQAANIMNASTLAAADRQLADIRQREATQGISPDSSSAALIEGDFAAQVNQGIASESAQLGLSEEQLLIQSLLGEGQAHGGDVSGWQTFGNVLSGSESAISAIAGGVSEKFGVGGTAGSILDIIAGL